MKKYLLLMLTLLLCVSLFSCGFNFNEEFIFGEPEVPTAPPLPPLSQMDSDVMMHVLNEKGVTFENYFDIDLRIMLIVLENDPDAEISVSENYSKQFEQMREIVRERGSSSTKGFELTTMSDEELISLLDEKMGNFFEKNNMDVRKTIYGSRRMIFELEQDINGGCTYGAEIYWEWYEALRAIVKEYHGIE
ncbi:MAG: hypothetical protein IJW52_04445 [Clostridia bacterium]|nr:hypothetical protein [Clostridia bacterium]